jgi:hypothetical protein
MRAEVKDTVMFGILPTAAINAALEEYCILRESAMVCPRCGCELKQRMDHGAAVFCGCCGQLISLEDAP